MIGAFLLVGQSNMAGRGEMGRLSLVVNPDVLMFRDGQWLQAVEPVHQDKDIAAESMATAFGDAVQRAAGGQVGLIPCAMGGGALAEWTPGSALFEQAVDTTRAALARRTCMKGILWHQGEADAGKRTSACTYAVRLASMLNALKGHCSPRRRWLFWVSLAAFGTRKAAALAPPWSTGRSGRLRVATKATPDVSSLGLTDKGDGQHFDTVSLREMGRRQAACEGVACAGEHQTKTEQSIEIAPVGERAFGSLPKQRQYLRRKISRGEKQSGHLARAAIEAIRSEGGVLGFNLRKARALGFLCSYIQAINFAPLLMA